MSFYTYGFVVGGGVIIEREITSVVYSITPTLPENTVDIELTELIITPTIEKYEISVEVI